MGGSASPQSTGEDGQIRNTDQWNIGLVNVSGEGSNLESWLEIATCAGIIIIILYIFGYLCQKRRQKRMAQLHAVLRGIQINPEAARVPIFQSSAPTAQPPPAYPTLQPQEVFAKTSAEIRGSQIMSQYAWKQTYAEDSAWFSNWLNLFTIRLFHFYLLLNMQWGNIHACLVIYVYSNQH